MAANTQPIFPPVPFNWKANLKSQIIPREIGSQVPNAWHGRQKSDALIPTIFVQHLGANTATVVRLYHSDGTGYALLSELTLPAITTATEGAAIDPVKFVLPDMLPTGNTGLHLAPAASLSVGLGTAIASGIQVWALGGNY